MKLKFGTKAENLTKLEGALKEAKILPQFCFCIEDWELDSRRLIDKLSKTNWFSNPLIVRSSALIEDSKASSHAGEYLSVQNVKGEKELILAVNKVIKSYKDRNKKNQVLIQPQLQDVVWSGVAFSFDSQTGAPYIVVNYDDKSGSTDTVTSGRSNDLKTYYYYRFAKVKPLKSLGKVINLIFELEKLFGTEFVDIEFAQTKGGGLYLFQVRPLIVSEKLLVSKENHFNHLCNLESKIKQANKPQPNIVGSKVIYGIMPDWNPAEIIGIRPRPLALSLYKELITDNIWAYQRDNYGYRNLRSFPLMQSFYGIPYIDVRVDFNSFIPADVDEVLAEKLVNYYLDRLIKLPAYHDKVEFEIVYSCYTFDLAYRLIELPKSGFTKEECEQISSSLRKLTNNIIHDEYGLWRQDLEKIEILEKRYKSVIESDLYLVSKIYWLIEDCKRYGTLPFSGLARAAFIAVQLLNSLMALNILEKQDVEMFMQSLETISSKMKRDFYELKKEEFLKVYGHLRPGTYDMLSPRYDENPDQYFDWKEQKKINITEPVKYKLTLKQKKQINYLLQEHKIDCTAESLFRFIKSAIEGREYAKFVFTKSLSNSISLFKELGKKYGFNPDELSYSNISLVGKLYSSCDDIESILDQDIKKGKESYKSTKQIILPPLITHEKDIWSFLMPETEPNYITMKKVMGERVLHTDNKKKITGNVLFVPNADPGYDWIFSHGVAGFITMYGGANSHMAIRAAELGIPAVIGVGETLYDKLVKSNKIEIDCANKLVTIIK